MADNLTKKINPTKASSRRYYEIQPREPWELPGNEVQIPSPSNPPQSPTVPNLLSMLLGPILMLVMYGVLLGYQASQNTDGTAPPISPIFFMMPLVGIAQPIAAWVSYKNQTKKYAAAMQAREMEYKKKLTDLRQVLDALVEQQRTSLNREYPLLPRLIGTGLGNAHKKRLWWRRAADPDFLSLRMGTGDGRASFKINPPRNLMPEDPLAALAGNLQEDYQAIRDIPLLLDLPKIGSIALDGKGGDTVFGMARRLVLDLIVNHSPQDVQLILLSDHPSAAGRWEWLKWVPHTLALNQGETHRRLAFDPDSMEKTMKWLMDEFFRRSQGDEHNRRKIIRHTALVVLLDDSRDMRRTDDIQQLVNYGLDVNIHLIFIGGRFWPKDTRARIDTANTSFKYVETLAGEEKGRRLSGSFEPVSLVDCERVARRLAGFEVTSTGGSDSLPERVRLTDILPTPVLSTETIRSSWERKVGVEDLLQFPLGLSTGRKGLVPASLNLLPPDAGGSGSYHTILVGTTGSGKSELMKSLVLAAACKYSPRLLNFFFLDFKGGAAFNDFKPLPHVVGVVTNLGPQLVNRALSALDAEFKRRQNLFLNDGVKDIWEYNARYSSDPMPHILLLLDEFSEGMKQFSQLPEMLDMLGRQGRSLGIYMLLGNQTVNSAMDHLLTNVGWRIVMKLNKIEDSRPLIKRIPNNPTNIGQGFLHSANENDEAVFKFQGAFGGFPLQEPEEEVEQTFKIFAVESNGRWNPSPLYTNVRRLGSAEKDRKRIKESEKLIADMSSLSMEYPTARPIYLEPLEGTIHLEEVYRDAEVQPTFASGAWNTENPGQSLQVPIGYTDSTAECRQDCLQVDFTDQDGHLWLIGSPSSGKAMSIETTLISLAMTHTPQQVWFYILEFGATGGLKQFGGLPHCGAVITPKDPVELLDRLIRFLDEEMTRRTNQAVHGADIFLVINNFSEFKNTHPDHADRLAPFINGKAIGIHLIISTNRKLELPNKLGIARKIVLRLANRDEYMDAVGGRIPFLPTLQSEGRGLWLDGGVLECQIARPEVDLEGKGVLLGTREICVQMNETWKGPRPPQIQLLSKEIPLGGLLHHLPPATTDSLPFPVGIAFDSLEIVWIDILKDMSRWLVIGPPRSGKSNFLTGLANVCASQASGRWKVLYISVRRPPPSILMQAEIHKATTTQQAVDQIQQLVQSLEQPQDPSQRYLVLFDDLGSAFEAGREGLLTAMNQLTQAATLFENNLILVGAGMPDELRSQQINPLLKLLKQNRMGLALSKESSDLEFLTAPMLTPQQRRMELSTGRGFWVKNGKSTLIQSPMAEAIRMTGNGTGGNDD